MIVIANTVKKNVVDVLMCRAVMIANAAKLKNAAVHLVVVISFLRLQIL